MSSGASKRDRKGISTAAPVVKNDIKADKYFTATKQLVRYIEPHHLSGRRPRVAPSAFARGYSDKDGKIEDYLSVNCEGLDNLDEILNYYFKNWEHTPLHYIRHKIEKINAAANTVKLGAIAYDATLECFCFSDGGSQKPAYSHKPKGNGESYSHSGVMFYPALGELGEFELADALTNGVKPSQRVIKKRKEN